MPDKSLPQTKHFDLKPLGDGVYACIHKLGGAAFSNAGIIDLGDRTLVVDAFDTLAAGRALRSMAEALLGRPVDMLVLTHSHGDHWTGASAFDSNTTLVSSRKVRQVCIEQGPQIVTELQNKAQWKEAIRKVQKQLDAEGDERLRASLQNSISHYRHILAEAGEFRPRYADQTFADEITFHGSRRSVEVRRMGRGHSGDDTVILLKQESLAFLGDIGFFDTQPFMGDCSLEHYRKQLAFFMEAGFEVLVPGHGPVGGKQDLALQSQYFDVMEELVGQVVQRGGPLEEALQIRLPEAFEKWLIGGMRRFEANVRYLYAHLGGTLKRK